MKPYTKSKNAKKQKISRFYLIVTVSVVFYAIISLYSDIAKINDIKIERAELEAMIDDEMQEQLSLNSQKLYFESDSYIEKIAREKLGLVKPNDVIFIDRSNK